MGRDIACRSLLQLPMHRVSDNMKYNGESTSCGQILLFLENFGQRLQICTKPYLLTLNISTHA